MTKRLRLGLGTALFAVMSASVIACGLLVHLAWRNAAMAVSGTLLAALEERIADAVRREWWLGITTLEQRLLAIASTPASREAAGLAEALAAEAESAGFQWLAHLTEDGAATIATRGLSPPGDALWRSAARMFANDGWIRIAPTAASEPMVAAVRRVPGGILVGGIGDSRLALRLGAIPVGRSGGTFVLAPSGAVVIAARPQMAAADQHDALRLVAEAAGRAVAARAPRDLDTPEARRILHAGEAFAVGLSPLWFQGWQMAIILPEADYLAGVERMIARVSVGLAAFLLVAGGIAALATRVLVANPIRQVAADLAHIERFELESIPRRRSALVEIDRLSEAIGRMSAGLADFGKFIPTELVRQLITEGVRAEPGGSRREITVLFADLAGFTALTERLGDAAVPVVGRFLDMASRAIAAEAGTVDKYIGDAVMAFWGAPVADDAHAARACRAALAIRAGFLALQRADPLFRDLGLRIGIESGPAIVGNVGSTRRLNYTALGDVVNLASRLEGVNKVYGTTILLGPGARISAGATILAREVDRVAVYGRAEGVAIHELLGLHDAREPAWLSTYSEALAMYRKGAFARALAAFDQVLAQCPADGPARLLAARAGALLAHPPEAGWSAITQLGMK